MNVCSPSGSGQGRATLSPLGATSQDGQGPRHVRAPAESISGSSGGALTAHSCRMAPYPSRSSVL